MKKVILAISAIALFSIACNKAKTVVDPSTQNNIKHVRSEDDAIETYEYTQSIIIHNEGNTDQIEAIVSAPTQDILDSYLDNTEILFKPLDTSPTYTSEIEDDPEAVDEENGDDVRISIFNDEAYRANGYTLYTKKTRSVYNYNEDWDSQCDNTKIQWVSTTNSNNHLYITVRYKTCGTCQKYTLVNNILDVNQQSATYNKPSKRLYVKVKNNWKNRNVSFWD
jgi:hypothetical protein